jgi:hypothetical protein
MEPVSPAGVEEGETLALLIVPLAPEHVLLPILVITMKIRK